MQQKGSLQQQPKNQKTKKNAQEQRKNMYKSVGNDPILIEVKSTLKNQNYIEKL